MQMPRPFEAATRIVSGRRHPLPIEIRRVLPTLMAGLHGEHHSDVLRIEQWSRIGDSGWIVRLAAPHVSSPVIVKAALSFADRRSLRREHLALTALRAGPCPAKWKSLIPEPLSTMTSDGWDLLTETAVRGRPPPRGRRLTRVRSHLMMEAAEAISVLHAATGREVIVGDGLIKWWVSRPVRIVERILGSWSGSTEGAEIERVAAALRSRLLGWRAQVGCIHGDFWFANLLAERDGTLSGIIDWDSAGTDEPAFHDLLHLVLYDRTVGSGQHLGDVIRQALDETAWRPAERTVLAAGGLIPGTEEWRLALSLYWLRQMSTNLSRHPGYAADQGWVHSNIRRVAECL